MSLEGKDLGYVSKVVLVPAKELTELQYGDLCNDPVKYKFRAEFVSARFKYSFSASLLEEYFRIIIFK